MTHLFLEPPIVSILPDDVVYGIFTHLSALEVAIAQQTCKQWHIVAQHHSNLWRDTGSFFERHYEMQMPLIQNEDQAERVFNNIGRFCKGFEALLRLTKGQMDYIFINFNKFRLEKIDKEKDNRLLEEAQTLVTYLRKADVTTLWIDFPGTGTIDRTTSIYQSVLGCSKLKELKLTSNQHVPFDISPFSIRSFPIMGCRLEYLDIDGRLFEMWHAEEGLITILQNLKHFKLRVEAHVPDSNTIFSFLYSIRETLNTLERLVNDCGDDADIFVGKLPVFAQEDVVFPELTRLTITGHAYHDWEFEFDEMFDPPDLREEEVERMVQNLSIRHSLVCPKLESLSMGSCCPCNTIVSPRSMKNLTSLKLATLQSETIIGCVSNTEKLKHLTFVLECFDDFMAVREYASTGFDIPFKIEIDLNNCDVKCGVELKAIVRDLKNEAVDEGEKNTYCEFKFENCSEEDFQRALTRAEWCDLEEQVLRAF